MFKKLFLILSLSVYFFLPGIISAQNATLYFSPSSGIFEEGQSFWLNVTTDTKGEKINAIAAYFAYPEDKLEFLGVNTAGSALEMWAEKMAKSGIVNIAGGTPTPGFSGIQKIASVGFKVKTNTGSANLKFSQESAILTDAENKNILNLGVSGQGNYNFKPKSISTPSTPLPVEPKAPVISEIEAKNINRNSATISWKTDKTSDSQVEFGLTIGYGMVLNEGGFSKDHFLFIPNLAAGTTYHFKVKSAANGGEGSESQDFVFTTLGYIGEIKILDLSSGQSLAEAEVSLADSSENTDEEGIAVFQNLPLGEQWISVKYKDHSSSFLIEVLDKEEPQIFEIKFPVKKSANYLFPIITLSFIIVIVSVLILTLKILKKKRSVNQLPVNKN